MSSVFDESNPRKKILQSILRPVLRFCFRHSFTTRELFQVIKEEFIQVASEELRERGKRPTHNKIALLTGLDRRDIKKLLLDDEEPKRPVVSPAARVLTAWQSVPEFMTSRGKPRVLKINEECDEFRELVESVSKEFYAPTLLKELLHQQVIERTATGGVRLVEGHQRIGLSEDPVDGFELLSDELNYLILSVEENILRRQKTPNAHLRTAFDNISISSLPKIRKWLIEENARFHKKLRLFLRHHDVDYKPKSRKQEEAGAQVVVSSFSLTSSSSSE